MSKNREQLQIRIAELRSLSLAPQSILWDCERTHDIGSAREIAARQEVLKLSKTIESLEMELSTLGEASAAAAAASD